MRALAWALLACLLGLAPALRAGEEEPELSKERVVFRTIGGDFVFALYPKVAPETCKSFLAMVRAGVYDSTHFHRLHPKFVLQNSGHNDRTLLLQDAQRATVSRLPAEFSSTLRHTFGVLSMAHADGDPNSGESSFSIHLGDAPHLDGKYTIFGRVVEGMGVVDEFLKVPRDEDSKRPNLRLQVLKAEVADSAEDLAAMNIVAPHEIALPEDPEKKNELTQYVPAFAGVVLAIMLLISVAQWALAERIPPRTLASIQLISVLVGALFVVALLTPMAQRQELLAVLLYFGILGLFKLMGKFESGGPKAPPKPPTQMPNNAG
ncbi:MAG: peptidylprolyl isomerase [Planctomycetota bacterium]|nr:peptidylprolyl isomerase [Planctomycetota bacterium]